jgi:hypothetical protein
VAFRFGWARTRASVPSASCFQGLKKTTDRLVTGDVLKLCNRVRKQQAAKAIKTTKWICKEKQLIGEITLGLLFGSRLTTFGWSPPTGKKELLFRAVRE